MPTAVHEPPRTPPIEWRPGAAQMVPALAIAAPALLAIVVMPAGEQAWPWMALIAAGVTIGLAVAVARHRQRPRTRQLIGAAGAIVLDGRTHRVCGAWLAPGWLMVRLEAGRSSCRLWIHSSEVSESDFARLRRFARHTLPAVSRRPALTRRADP